MITIQQPLLIIGIELRTTNDNQRSFMDIPPFWDRFIKEDCATQIPNKADKCIYAVYTNFENQGKNNYGTYSLIIGCNATPGTIPPYGYTSVTIPSGSYRVFSVEKGRPDKVGDVWRSIWEIPNSEKKNWKYSCEFERYQESGEIEIFIGLNN